MINPRDAAKEGRLSSAIGTDQSDDLPRTDVKIYIEQCCQPAEVSGYPSSLKEDCHDDFLMPSQLLSKTFSFYSTSD